MHPRSAKVAEASNNRQSADDKPKRGLVPASLANLTGGSRKGVPNKTTALLKDAILAAAAKAGGKGGLEAYLARQADENPGPFMALLGKVLPMQVTGEDGGALVINIRKPGA